MNRIPNKVIEIVTKGPQGPVGPDPFPFSGSAIISGSLEVSGSITASHFIGTASYIEASNIDQPFENLQVLNSITASHVSASETGSFGVVKATVVEGNSPLTIKGVTEIDFDNTNLFGNPVFHGDVNVYSGSAFLDEIDQVIFRSTNTTQPADGYLQIGDSPTPTVINGGSITLNSNVTSSNISSSGYISASTYYGDGQYLENVQTDTGSFIVNVDQQGDGYQLVFYKGDGSYEYITIPQYEEPASLGDSFSGVFSVNPSSITFLQQSLNTYNVPLYNLQYLTSASLSGSNLILERVHGNRDDLILPLSPLQYVTTASTSNGTITFSRSDGSTFDVYADSFPYTGSAEISGSLNVVGPVSASTYYGDGSNLEGIEGFPYTGSAEITGSLGVTGSLTVTGSEGKVSIDEGQLKIYDSNRDKYLYFNESNRKVTISSNLISGYMTFSLDANAVTFGQPVGMGIGPSSYDKLALRHSSTVDNANIIKSYTPSNTPALFVKGNGKVGIGTDLPEEALQVTPSLLVGKKGFSDPIAGQLRVASPNTSYGEIGFTSQYDILAAGIRSYAVGDTTYERDLRFYIKTSSANANDGVEKMRIDSSGNVGINTTTPSSSLHVKGANDLSDNYALRVGNSTSDNIFVVGNDGHIGVNTTPSSAYTMYLDDGVQASNTLFVNSYNRIGWHGGARQWLTGWSGRITFNGGNEGEWGRFTGGNGFQKLVIRSMLHLSQNGGAAGDTRFTRLDTGTVAIGNNADDASGTLYVGNLGVGGPTGSLTHTLEVTGDVSASTYYGDGSNLEGIEGFPYTGSAEITGSLGVTGSLSVLDGNISTNRGLYLGPNGSAFIRSSDLGHEFLFSNRAHWKKGSAYISSRGGQWILSGNGIAEPNDYGQAFVHITKNGSISKKAFSLDYSANGLKTTFDVNVSGSLIIDSEGDVSINNNTLISGSLNVTSSFTASGLNYPSTDGLDRQVIKTDGNGNLSFGYPENIDIAVKNVSGDVIYKGTPCYITGSGTNGNIAGIIPADAGNPSLMPAGVIAGEEIADGEEGIGLLSGFIQGVDTSLFESGDSVYVAVGGGYTNVKPTGSAALIQKLGSVEKSGANGSGVIFGAGRANDLPNWETGKVMVGTDTYPATSSVIHLDEVNNSVGINTSTPGGLFQIEAPSSTPSDFKDYYPLRGGYGRFIVDAYQLPTTSIRTVDLASLGAGARDGIFRFITDRYVVGDQEQLRITPDGLAVGGNGFFPSASLHIKGANNLDDNYALRIDSSTANNVFAVENSGDIILEGSDRYIRGNTGGAYIRFYQDGLLMLEANNAIRLETNLRFGGKYDIADNSGNTYLNFYNTPYDSTSTKAIRQYAPIVRENGHTEPAIFSREDLEFRIDSNNTSTDRKFVITKHTGSEIFSIHEDGNAYLPSGSLTISGNLKIDGIVTGSLTVEGSGSTIFEVNGSEGQLFSITDSLSGSLFAVSDVSGLPILEVFSDDRVVAGAFNQNDFVISGSRVGIGTDSPETKLHVVGDGRIDGTLTMRYPSGVINTLINSEASNLTNTGNIAIGVNAPLTLTNGYSNILIGSQNGIKLTSGHTNVMVGVLSGRYTTGDSNTLLGTNSGQGVDGSSTFSNTVAVGYQALTALTTGLRNTAVGYQAGDSVLAGSDNTFLGYGTDLINGNNSFNTVIGSGAYVNSNGNRMTAVGYSARAGGSSTSIGVQAGSNNSRSSVAMGYQAGNGAGQWNTSIGNSAHTFSTGNYNTSIGGGANRFTSGDNNVALGYGAAYGVQNTSSFSNTVAVGYQALTSLTTGANNTAVGYQAGDALTTEGFNTLVGYGTEATSNANIAIGYGARGVGGQTVSIGYQAQAGSVTNGYQNVNIGYQSGYEGASEKSVSLGAYAGFGGTIRSVSLGQSAGYGGGDYGVFIGYQAGYNETGSNKLYIENSNSSSPLIYGEFDNDIVQINGDFTVTGTITELSAQRFKENISPLTGSLEKANQLQGVSFNRIGQSEKEIGFIAEQVAEVLPELVDKDKEGNITGVQYSRVTAVLLESVKELSSKLNEMEARLERLENK